MKNALLLLVVVLVACTPAPPENGDIAALLRGDGSAEFAPIQAPVTLAFPADHGPHYAQRLEWWYFTGNLRGDNQQRYGYQLTIFRLGLKPQAPSDAPLAREQLLMGHFALTDISAAKYHSFERFARLDQRIASVKNPPLALRLENWSITQLAGEPLAFALRAEQDNIAIDLTVRAASALLAQGDNGYSQKSANSASAYYSVPRLKTSGTLHINGEKVEVSGLSWLDREWSSSQLARDQIGWRWYALHLDDGSNLMVYALLRADGRIDQWSKGSWQRADGEVTALAAADFSIEALRWWQASDGARYPVESRVRAPQYGLDITVSAALDQQRFDGLLRYWEGAVSVRGSHSGTGYLEMTGAQREAATEAGIIAP